MNRNDIKRADEIDVTVSKEQPLPEEWEKTHEEYRKPVMGSSGYYIYTYESEHFLVSQDIDFRFGETVHNAVLMKVKRDENGERLTSLGTGVFYAVGVEDGRQAFSNGTENVDWDDNREAHEEAEKAAFQLAYDLMQEVNAGKYKHKRYDAD